MLALAAALSCILRPLLEDNSAMLSARKADVTVCETTLSAQAGVMQRLTWRARQKASLYLATA